MVWFLKRVLGGKDKNEEAVEAAIPEAEPVATPEAVPEPVREPAQHVDQAPLPEPSVAVEQPAPKTTEPDKPKQPGFFGRLTAGLAKSTSRLTGGVDAIFNKRKLDDDTVEELEELLIAADLGPTTAAKIAGNVAKGRYDKQIEPNEIRQLIADEIEAILKPCEQPLYVDEAQKPFTVLVVGVNGGGKTTSIGKISAALGAEGWKVMIAAADTFRAAAIEQLQVWAERAKADFVHDKQGTDPAAVAFRAMQAAQAANADVLFVDTAGRLQNRSELMQELAKIRRVIAKFGIGAPHATILVLDATTGQNAVAQVEAFTNIAEVTGLVVTKLDGSAKAGVLVGIADRFKLPIYGVGIGESIEDLTQFDARDFSRALVGLDEA